MDGWECERGGEGGVHEKWWEMGRRTLLELVLLNMGYVGVGGRLAWYVMASIEVRLLEQTVRDEVGVDFERELTSMKHHVTFKNLGLGPTFAARFSLGLFVPLVLCRCHHTQCDSPSVIPS